MRLSNRMVAVVAALLFFAMESVALAASMSGAVRTYNPSAGTVRSKLVVDNTVGTTGTGTGRRITVAPNVFSVTAQQQRIFPAFPGVAQNSEFALTTHNTLVFEQGGGAVGLPAGSGGVTSFTTPTTGGGITTVKEINWCPSFAGCASYMEATAPGAGNYLNIRPGPNVFGGTFRLLRHIGPPSGAWFVFNPGASVVNLGFNPNLRGVVETPGGGTSFTFDQFWSAGVDNLEVVTDPNPPNLLYSAVLGSDGAVETLLNFNGTSPNDPPDGFATGFKMTTGTIFVSDATPTTPGRPFFSSSTAGYDNRDASGNGNIQLVGGSTAYGGLSGNTFFRVTRLTMAVPEPTSTVALLAGLAGFAGLAGLRKRRNG